MDGDLPTGSGDARVKDCDHFQKRTKSEPLQVTQELWLDAREDAGVEEGMPFSAKLYGERVLSENFKGHATLHRVWLMLSAIHRLQWTGQHDIALAQNSQCLKTVASCLKQGGVWKGAWEYTHLPDLHDNSLGVSLQERASNSKYLRERKAVEDIIDAARKDDKNR